MDIRVKRIMKSNTDSVNNLAFGAVCLGAVVTDFTLWNSKNGRFVSLGGRRKGKDRDGNEKWYDTTYIDDVATKEAVTTAVSEAFDNME